MSIVSLRCDECGNPSAGCKAVDCAMRSYAVDREATLDEHEKAIESIDPKGYYGLSPLALGKIIAAYFVSLREQGVSAIDPAELQAVTMERDMLRDRQRDNDEREIAYVKTIGRLDAALRGIVDLYRHPDTGRVIVEAGSSDADDALIFAIEALDR